MAEQLRLLDDGADNLPANDRLCIRESKRARRLILQAIPPSRLELVVPRGTRPQEIEAFLSENRAWLEKARDELEARYPAEQRGLPTRIDFAAIDRRWEVEYAIDSSVLPRRRVFEDRVQLTIPHRQHSAAWRMLRDWFMSEAGRHLKPWLLREAERVGLSPKRVQVRTQRTRWGSCSSRRNVSLNACLMFLEPDVVRYLLVHELCHLRHLNHSRRYWRLVERWEPGYRALDRALSQSWDRVPVWALLSRHGR